MPNAPDSPVRSWWSPRGAAHGEQACLLSSPRSPAALIARSCTLVVRDASTEAVSCFIHNPSLAEEKGSDVSIPGQCSASRIKMLPLVGKVEGTVL